MAIEQMEIELCLIKYKLDVNTSNFPNFIFKSDLRISTARKHKGIIGILNLRKTLLVR